MVTCPADVSRQIVTLLAVQSQAESVLEQLDPPRRAVVIMALLGLVVVGVLLVTMVLLGANWARRLARHRPAGDRTQSAAASATGGRLPRRDISPDPSQDVSGETVQWDATNETRTDSQGGRRPRNE